MVENNFTEPLESQQRQQLIQDITDKLQSLSDAELLTLQENLTPTQQSMTGDLPSAVRELETEAEGEKISEGVIFADFASFQEGDVQKANGEVKYWEHKDMFPVHLLENTGDGRNRMFTQAFPELSNGNDKANTLYCVSYLDSQGRVSIVGGGQIAFERRKGDYDNVGRLNTQGFKILFGNENSHQADLFISRMKQNPKEEIQTLLNDVFNNTAYPVTSPDGRIDNSRSVSTSLINDGISLNFVDLRGK